MNNNLPIYFIPFSNSKIFYMILFKRKNRLIFNLNNSQTNFLTHTLYNQIQNSHSIPSHYCIIYKHHRIFQKLSHALFKHILFFLFNFTLILPIPKEINVIVNYHFTKAQNKTFKIKKHYSNTVYKASIIC